MLYEVYRCSWGVLIGIEVSIINIFTVDAKETYALRAARVRKDNELKNLDNSLENSNEGDFYWRVLNLFFHV